jgi:hypothetical protein
MVLRRQFRECCVPTAEYYAINIDAVCNGRLQSLAKENRLGYIEKSSSLARQECPLIRVSTKLFQLVHVSREGSCWLRCPT